MAREIRLEIVAEGGALSLAAETLVDSSGHPWTAVLDASGSVIVLRKIPLWDLAIEGVQLGTALGDDPGDAAAEALRDAGVGGLPEAVAVRLTPHGEAGNGVMVFTLGGQAYQIDQARFNAEIAGTTRWTAARQKHKRQIDALRDELKRIVEQPGV